MWLQWIRENKIDFISIFGSVASVTALAIVLLDKIADKLAIRPELMAWRFVLFLVALAVMVAALFLMGAWLHTTYKNQRIGPTVKFLV